MFLENKIDQSGFFWIPENKTKKVPGRLTIENSGNIKLEITGLFDDSPETINRIMNTNFSYPRICGSIETSGYVTLESCHFIQSKFSSSEILMSIVRADQAFLGIGYDKDEAILLNTFQFSTIGLKEWIGISGIKVKKNIGDKSIDIQYKLPSKIDYKIDDDLELQITFSGNVPIRGFSEGYSITEETVIKLVSEEKRPVEYFISIAYKVVTFLCFTSNEMTCIKDVFVSDYDIKRGKESSLQLEAVFPFYYQSLPFSGKEKPFTPRMSLFFFGSVRDKLDSALKNWFDAYENFGPSFYSYFSSRSDGYRFQEGRFLALIQGLETYHRRTSDRVRMNQDDYEKLSRHLVSACPDKQQPWLEGRLKYGNELTLSQRLKDLVKRFPEWFGNKHSRRSYVRKVVTTRNYYTHYDERLKDEVAQGAELWQLCEKSEVLYQLLFMKEIGFTNDEMESLLKDNYSISQKLR